MCANIKPFETVGLDAENNILRILDQTRLPNETCTLHLTTQQEIWQAIYTLQVRGAPAIGIAAAFGIYLAAKQLPKTDYQKFYQQFLKAKDYLASARPTAVNLFWALDRMEAVVTRNSHKPIEEIISLLQQEAVAIYDEDTLACWNIGKHGAAFIRDGDQILTHCNAGELATSRYGTALAPIYYCHEQGYRLKIFADETRPLLQGARLTAFELSRHGIDTTVICDNMAAQVMSQGWINSVFVGADRIAANGDSCNKIGTLSVAILAHHFGIPFYVCAPISTLDHTILTGKDIPIEQRPETEISELWYQKKMVPEGVSIYNPAFDVVPHHLITAIITEKGVLKPPFDKSILKIGE